ncbi:MAG: glycosyltransferase family 2 protein [Deltaproteobacteria bacterium]|nr:glycosyltransferase family 2 protein [Deltaproteobacteria bacterium]
MSAVSIIIVNWNGKSFLADCLNGLRQQTYGNFSVIMVDNGSVDGSLDYVQTHYPEVKTIALSENSGFARANNIALQSVQTKYVALLNPDTVPDAGWLEHLVKALENHPQAGSAASKMLLYDKPNVIDRAGDAYTTAGTALLQGRGETSSKFDNREWVFGACAGAALYRRCMFEDIGLFDEDFFLLFEDVDLSFRAQLRGYKCLYAPDASVYHHVSSSIGDDSPTSVYYSHRNLEWVYIQNMPGSLIAKTILPHMIYVWAAFVFFVLKGRSADYIKAKWHALKGLKRALAKRRCIQKNRTAPDDYIWSLFEKERLLPRLTRRISKTSSIFFG